MSIRPILVPSRLAGGGHAVSVSQCLSCEYQDSSESTSVSLLPTTHGGGNTQPPPITNNHTHRHPPTTTYKRTRTGRHAVDIWSASWMPRPSIDRTAVYTVSVPFMIDRCRRVCHMFDVRSSRCADLWIYGSLHLTMRKHVV